MSNWRISITTEAKQLREFIQQGGSVDACIGTMQALIHCWNVIKLKLHRPDEEELRDEIEYLAGQASQGLILLQEGSYFGEPVDVVNICLRKLYDFCDENRIWLSL